MVFTPRAGKVHVNSLRKANKREVKQYEQTPNPELLDDENPEWTVENYKKARPASEVWPQIFGAKVAKEMLKPRGRPRVEFPKDRINKAID